MNRPLARLHELGQSVWLDYIDRSLIISGTLRRLIAEDKITGVTSNPSIFHKAVVQGHDYDEEIVGQARLGKDRSQIYEALVIDDLRRAADLLRGVYDATDGADGFVSLEVDPGLADDAETTVDQARRLFRALNRPNAMIKVPATPAGLKAITRLTFEGVNVNATLLFGISRYREVADAFVRGLEQRVDAGRDVARIASVASLFLSRIDLLVDPMLEQIAARDAASASLAHRLSGQTAVATARGAWRAYLELFDSTRFLRLGARPQRLLWASTSAKRPSDRPLKYVEPLIGPGTVNTLPPDTLEAYRQRGEPMVRLPNDAGASARVLEDLERMGISLERVSERLEREGIRKFAEAHDGLVATIGQRAEQATARTP